MMAENRANRSEDQSSYIRVKGHLDEIAEQIKSKDVPLEKALDLYEEAIRLGNSCADLIDTTDFSLEELEAFNGDEAVSGESDDVANATEEPAAEGDSGDQEADSEQQDQSEEQAQE